MDLSAYLKSHSPAAIAFSGGTDSAYLLYEALRSGAQICAYYVKTSFQPAFEMEDALRLTCQLNVPLKILEMDILSDPKISRNPSDRCYYCKKALFQAIAKAAAKDGFSVLMDGTNASDQENDRPGMRAIQELSVLSPLRECGLTKEKIREQSKKAGLFTWNKPAYACLATRIPTGENITEKKLRSTEAAETYLFSLGFSDFRIRTQGTTAKIQVLSRQMGRVLEYRESILEELKKYYTAVLLDMEARG